MMRYCLLAGLLLALTAQAAQFYTGQAARAVLGQSSFNSHESGITATALTVADGKLYVADASGKVLTFDLSQIPSPTEEVGGSGSTCRLCGFMPVSSISQRVAPGTATISAWGRSVVAIDTQGRRILFWRDISSRSAFIKPDVILHTGQSGLLQPVSVAIDAQHLFVGDAALHGILVWNSLPDQDDKPADTVLGGPSLDSTPAAATIDRPDALVSDGTNLYVSDASAHRILVFSPADSPLHPEAVANSATLIPGPLAGGTLISISGENLTAATASAKDDSSDPLPIELGGVQVIFNGVPLPLVSVNPQEIRAQLPYIPADLTSGSLYIRSEGPGSIVSITDSVQVTLAPASPGLFAYAGDEPRPGIAFRNDAPISTDQPAQPGDIIKLWVTGLRVKGDSKPIAGQPFSAGKVDVAPINVSVDGEPAEVLQVSLPPTSIGIYEALFRLPNLPYAEGAAHLTLTQDGVSSNTVTVSVRR